MNKITNMPLDKLREFHAEFDRVKGSRLRKFFMWMRINQNRLIQSLSIVAGSAFITRFVLKGAFSSLIGRKVSLRSLEIAVTYRCNSQCEQCSCKLSFDAKKEKDEKLTLQEIKNAIDQAVEMGAFQFVINGGEPLLEEEKVYELIRYIKKIKRYVHLCTNGTLLDENKIKNLKECGLDSVEMGFDSAFEEQHDKNRIKGSYNQILNNIKLFKKYGIKVILNTILTNEKVKSDDIIKTFLLAKNLGCLLQITPCCLTGKLKNKLGMKLTEEAKLYFYWLLSKSSNNRSDLYSSLTNIKCPAAREKIGLQPYGDVVSCPLIQIVYGNIRKTRLKEIQQEMLKNTYYSGKEAMECLPSMSDSFIANYLIDK